MNKTLTTLTLSLCFLTGPMASAQAPVSSAPVPPTDFVLSAGLLSAQGDALTMTHRTNGGFALEGGYQFSPKDYGVDFLVYGGWKKLTAASATPERPTSELSGPHLGFDIVYRPWSSLPLTLSTGPSAHVWKVKRQDQPDDLKGDQGVKLGWRIGIGYEINSKWSVGLKYTLTEWSSNIKPDASHYYIAPSRPAFLSLMGSYRF